MERRKRDWVGDGGEGVAGGGSTKRAAVGESTLKRPDETNTETVSNATIGRLLRDGTERKWAIPSP